MDIKDQVDKLLRTKGRCFGLVNWVCRDCSISILCPSNRRIYQEGVDSITLKYRLALKIKKNNYNIDAVIFEEML